LSYLKQIFEISSKQRPIDFFPYLTLDFLHKSDFRKLTRDVSVALPHGSTRFTQMYATCG